MFLLLLATWLVFGVTHRGNPLTLALVIILGTAVFAGLDLAVASRTEKTETVSQHVA